MKKRYGLDRRNYISYQLFSINENTKKFAKKHFPVSLGVRLSRLMITFILPFTRSDIRCKLPLSTTFAHGGVGVIIAEGVKIGEYCHICQNVTIGSKNSGVPVINDLVILYSNSVIMGNIKIGECSIIGAGAVVLDSIPPNSVAVGNPAKVIHTIQSKEEYLKYRFEEV